MAAFFRAAAARPRSAWSPEECAVFAARDGTSSCSSSSRPTRRPSRRLVAWASPAAVHRVLFQRMVLLGSHGVAPGVPTKVPAGQGVHDELPSSAAALPEDEPTPRSIDSRCNVTGVDSLLFTQSCSPR